MMKNRIVKDTVLLTIMQLILDSASLVLNGFITRQLGASAIGIFSLMGSFLGLAGIISNGNAFLCTSRLISEELGKTNGNPNRILFHGIRLCTMLSLGVSAVLIVAAKIPVCPHADLVWTIGYWSAVFAIIFCVVRGLPVVIEAKYLFEKK